MKAACTLHLSVSWHKIRNEGDRCLFLTQLQRFKTRPQNLKLPIIFSVSTRISGLLLNWIPEGIVSVCVWR